MDWSYIAGYFDGEGNVSCHVEKRGRRTTRLAWYNTHLESLRAIRSFIGAGRVHVRKQLPYQNAPVGVLYITRKADLLRVIDAMMPHLLIKKEAAEHLRAHLVANVDDHRSANCGRLIATSVERLVAMHFTEGLSLGEIARKAGVSPSAVSQLFKRHGIVPRPVNDGRLKGRPKSEETRVRMRESRRKMWADPSFRAAQLSNLARGNTARRAKVNITGFTLTEGGA